MQGERRTLFPFQKDVFYYTGRVQHPALFLEMRLGKTLITVRRLLAEKCRTVLVVAPYCALWQWEKELTTEGVPLPEIGYLIGDRGNRLGKLRQCASFLLMNKEGALVIPEIANYPWDAVVADESTFLKSPPHVNTSGRFGKRPSIAKFFSENFRNVKRRFILTGTPAPESPLDLFQQLHFLDPSILGCKSYYDFRFKWFVQIKDHSWALSKEGHVWLKERLSRYCYTLKRADVDMDVKKVYSRRLIRLPEKARTIYNKADREFSLDLANGKGQKNTVFATVSFMWCRRVCGGIVDGQAIHTEKFKELMNLVNGELRNEQIVVWCNFIMELAFIRTMLNKAKIPCVCVSGALTGQERRAALDDFANGRARVLVGQPECFKYGLDLSVAETVIYFSTPVGLETRLQSEDRIVNIRTGKPVLIIDLIVEHTVEEGIYESLLNKESSQELVRRLIQKR